MKKIAIIISTILASVTLGISFFIISCRTQSDSRMDQGTIVHKIEAGQEIWGLELKRGIVFKQKQILQFSDLPKGSRYNGTINLPEEFKHEGLRVKCTYVISDVIGTSSEWSTAISIIDIKLTN